MADSDAVALGEDVRDHLVGVGKRLERASQEPHEVVAAADPRRPGRVAVADEVGGTSQSTFIHYSTRATVVT